MKQAKRLLSMLLTTVIVFGVASPIRAAEGTGYSDVSKTDWYAEAVAYMTEKGLMNGTDTNRNTFTPNGTLTRAMLATVFYRMAGSPAVTGEDSFTDTEAGTWYSDAVLWADQTGLVQGYGNGLFGTTDPVTQEQLVTILHRYAGEPEGTGDTADTDSWYAAGVSWARSGLGLSDDANLGFTPKENATRAQIAAILHTYLTLENDEADSVGKSLVIYFSAAGNTDAGVDAVTSATRTSYQDSDYGAAQLIAKFIGDYTGADLSPVRVKNVYPDEYNNMAEVAKEEADNDRLPELTSTIENLDDYDTVFLVYPIWWYTMPRSIYTVLDQYDLSGKNILIATTHAGSRLADSLRVIPELEPDANVVSDAFTVSANSAASAKADVESWLDRVEEYWK